MDQLDCFDTEIIGSKKANIKITYAQMILILEALNDYRKDIKENLDNVNGPSGKRFLELKLENIDMLDKYLEKGINFNFEEATNKCLNRRKCKATDEGMETFNWLGE